MEVLFGPNSLDQPNLLYKLQNKLQVFRTNNSFSNRGYSLVATSSKYGIVFIASPNGTLSVYNINNLIGKESIPQFLSVKLPDRPTFIAVSCDGELLAVTGSQTQYNIYSVYIYKITDFQNVNVSPINIIKCNLSGATFVSSLQWNPCIPDTLAISFFDGTLVVSQATTDQVKKIQSKARCICWSPKGKQLVTGNSDGTLCQYKPDLTPMKVVPAPNLFEGAPVEALAIYWISTFQFAVVFRNAADNSRPCITLVNTPKAGTPSCLNYEDICFSMGSNRPWYYYLLGVAQWNIILGSSSNSMEIATLGSADGANWVHWTQNDTARPELPLTGKSRQENYPVGLCIDTSAVQQLPWGENEVLPYMPMLFVVSQTGVLTIFNIINLNKEAPQICTPPQTLTLPLTALTSDIPDDSTPPAAPAPTVPPPQQQQQQQPPVLAPVVLDDASVNATQVQFYAKPSFAQPQAFSTDSQKVEQKYKEPEPSPVSTVSYTKPVPQVATPPQEVNTALKAEQERLNKQKADQELKEMLIREVNEFQMELYSFMVRSQETQNKVFKDIDSITSGLNLQTLDAEKLRNDCSMEELRAAIIQLKLELVRACAVVAEARTQAETKELPQWTQADPLTTKRMASVKKLAYYVETQLDRAQKALDYKWNEIAFRDNQSNKPGQRMIRPILDDVYRPLVRQQEILGRQEAVLKTLKNTLKECDVAPMFKSTSLLRSTPFKKDPLSKLTKNILNMSIEAQPKAKEMFTAQKLDALRDVLSNHKTIKIKPVNVELRQHLAAMRLSYERSMKEKSQSQVVKTEPPVVNPVQTAPRTVFVKSEPKPAFGKPSISVASFTPVATAKNVPSVPNVARTLFADQPKKEPQTVQPQPISIPKAPMPSFAPSTTIAPPIDTRSVLQHLLQKDLPNKPVNVENKKDSSTFMGQKICSPSAFAVPSTPPSAPATSPPSLFTSKPIADMNSMFDKLKQDKGWLPFVPESKPQAKPKSDETGESEQSSEPAKKVEIKNKEERPMTNLFGMKASTPLATTPQNTPDVVKSNVGFSFGKENKSLNKIVEKLTDKSKENVPEKSTETITSSDKNEPKPLTMQTTNKPEPSISVTTEATIKIPVPKETPKAMEPKTDNTIAPKTPEKSEPSSPSASSLFAAANAASSSPPKMSSIFGSPVTSQVPSASSAFSFTSMPLDTASEEKIPDTKTSASSIFGTATSAQATISKPTESTATTESIATTAQSSDAKVSKPSPSTQPPTATPPNSPTSQPDAKSLFSSQNASVFGTQANSQSGGIFSPTTTKSVFGTASTTQSVFGSPATTPQSIFGTSVSSPQSVFGSSTTTQSIFGGTTTPTASVFPGAASTQAGFGSIPATTQSVFGTTSTVFGSTTPTTQSVFGSPTTTSSVFGSTVTTASSFGAPATSASPVFGITTTAQSVFGTTGAATTKSVFGPTTQASVFSSPTSQASIFGSTQPVFGSTPPSTQSSVFGASQSSPSSLFGTAQSTQPSVFGTPTVTTAQSSSLFGGAESNLFEAASISTTSAPSPTSGGNIFGGGSTSGTVFGSGNTNIFGGKSTFGQSNTAAASIFGGGASFGQKAPANNTWSSGNTTGGSGFGSGFGQQATTQASSIFGGSTGGSFSTPSPTEQAFSNPQQSSTFGAAPFFGGSPGFGSKPGFGQPASFGSPPSGGSGFGSFGGFNKSPTSGFGAPATFGGGATFGGTAFGNTSPGFGGQSPTPGFGSPTQANATFESLATQETVTFGNLAQQSGQTGFNASPAFSGWRG